MTSARAGDVSKFSSAPYPDHAHHPPRMSPRCPMREKQIRMAIGASARHADRRLLHSRIQ